MGSFLYRCLPTMLSYCCLISLERGKKIEPKSHRKAYLALSYTESIKLGMRHKCALFIQPKI